MNSWPRTTFQKEREQHNASTAYHLAIQHKHHEFPARDSQGRHIDIFFASRGAKPSTDYRFRTRYRQKGSCPRTRSGRAQVAKCGLSRLKIDEFEFSDGVSW